MILIFYQNNINNIVKNKIAEKRPQSKKSKIIFKLAKKEFNSTYVYRYSFTFYERKFLQKIIKQIIKYNHCDINYSSAILKRSSVLRSQIYQEVLNNLKLVNKMINDQSNEIYLLKDFIKNIVDSIANINQLMWQLVKVCRTNPFSTKTKSFKKFRIFLKCAKAFYLMMSQFLFNNKNQLQLLKYKCYIHITQNRIIYTKILFKFSDIKLRTNLEHQFPLADNLDYYFGQIYYIKQLKMNIDIKKRLLELLENKINLYICLLYETMMEDSTIKFLSNFFL